MESDEPEEAGEQGADQDEVTWGICLMLVQLLQPMLCSQRMTCSV